MSKRFFCIFLLQLFVFQLFGCKIEQSSGTGGKIQSESGKNDCPSGSVCVIDIPKGVPFTETFTVMPKNGMVFGGWTFGNGYLCGGSLKPCQLSLTGELTDADTVAKLSAKFHPKNRNSRVINPLPDSILIDHSAFTVKEIEHFHFKHSIIDYHGWGDTDLDGNPEIFISGWTFRGWDVTDTPPPAPLLVYEANPDQTRKISGTDLLGQKIAPGTAFLRVEDFDKNGYPDLLIAGHNESPFILTNNLLFLNQGSSFKKSIFGPKMAMHEGDLGDFNGDGYSDLIASAYRIDLDFSMEEWVPGPPYGALMLFINDKVGGFDAFAIISDEPTEGISENDPINHTRKWVDSGSAATMCNLDADAETEIIVIDAWTGTNADSLVLDNIKFERSHAYGEVVTLPAPYFHTHDEFSGNPSLFVDDKGSFQSHDIEVKCFDFDNDGDQDVLVSSMIWVEDGYDSAGILQFLKNNGGLKFEDVTDDVLFNYTLSQQSSHEMRFLDVNHDGFEDIVMVESSYAYTVPHQWTGWDGELHQTLPNTWSNEVLINTGNGKFISSFWRGFHLLTLRQENIFKKYSPEFEPYSLIDQRYFPYITKNGLLGFITTGRGYEDINFVFDARAKSRFSTGPNGTDPALKGAPGFSEYYYLTENPDVLQAIKDGQYKSGLDHYIEVGKSQGRPINAR